MKHYSHTPHPQMDRYLTVDPTVDQKEFQLLAMTCLCLAIKLNEYNFIRTKTTTTTMETISTLSKQSFTVQDMERKELELLQRLKWHVHPPTPQAFLKYFIITFGIDNEEAYEEANFLVELSVLDYYFVDFMASEIALAALMNVMEKICFSPLLKFENLNLPTNLGFLQSTNIQLCRNRLSLTEAQTGNLEDHDENSHPSKSPVSTRRFYGESNNNGSSMSMMTDETDDKAATLQNILNFLGIHQ